MDLITISLAVAGVGASALAAFVANALSGAKKIPQDEETVVVLKFPGGRTQKVHLPAGSSHDDVEREIEKVLGTGNS